MGSQGAVWVRRTRAESICHTEHRRHSGAGVRLAAAIALSILMGSIALADRAQDITGWLPARPAGFGKPISDRAYWNSLATEASARRTIAGADKILQQPLPVQPDDLFLDYTRNGNRTRWQNVANARRGRIAALTLAECLQNRGRYLPALEEAVRAICVEKTWVMSAHDHSLDNFNGKQVDIDLGSSAVGLDMAMCRYLLESKLSAPCRNLISDNLRKRIFTPFQEMVSGKRKANWWMHCDNNWNAVCLANVTCAALAAVDDRAERAFYVVAAEDLIRNFLRGFTPDGYCSEGVGYWNYGFGHYILLAEAVFQSTRGREDLMSDPKVAVIAQFGRRMEIVGDVYPAFADCSVTAKPDDRLGDYLEARFCGAKDVRRIGEKGGLDFESLLFRDAVFTGRRQPGGAAVRESPLRSWFADAGVLICRPAEGTAGKFGVALKGGNNNENHNHNDLGSYVVVPGRQPVLLDPGSEVYTARTFSMRRYDSNVLNSFGHAVPVVAGKLQRPGAEARARVLDAKFSDSADVLRLDISSAYPVKELQALTREFVYSRGRAPTLTVTDVAEFSSPQTLETALITLGTVKQVSPSVLEVADEKEALRVTIESAAGPFEIRTEAIKEDIHARHLPTRVGIRLKQPAQKARIKVTIVPV
jgi:hypothetical protein